MHIMLQRNSPRTIQLKIEYRVELLVNISRRTCCHFEFRPSRTVFIGSIFLTSLSRFCERPSDCPPSSVASTDSGPLLHKLESPPRAECSGKLPGFGTGGFYWAIPVVITPFTAGIFQTGTKVVTVNLGNLFYTLLYFTLPLVSVLIHRRTPLIALVIRSDITEMYKSVRDTHMHCEGCEGYDPRFANRSAKTCQISSIIHIDVHTHTHISANSDRCILTGLMYTWNFNEKTKSSIIAAVEECGRMGRRMFKNNETCFVSR